MKSSQARMKSSAFASDEIKSASPIPTKSDFIAKRFHPAQVGFFIALPSRIVEICVRHSTHFISPCFVGYRCAKTAHCAVFACLPTPSAAAKRLPEVVKRGKARRSNQRKKDTDWCPFRCARAIKKIFLPFCLRDLNLTD